MSHFNSLIFWVLSLTCTAQAFDMGVNIHSGGSSLTANQQFADIMSSRNLKTGRMDFYAGMNLTNFRDQIQKIRANGGRVEVSLQNSYQWDSSCNSNLSYVEQDSYNQTVTLVNQIKDLVSDFELLNEIQLRPEILSEVSWNTVGTATAPYYNQPCVATITAAVRGMGRGIHDAGASSGQSLRVILGVVGRDFGFLTFMQQNSVPFDVVGYHIYPHYGDASLLSDTWFGTGGPLYQLSLFGKPLHINEFNCGEIYDSNYENTAGYPDTETCFKSLAKHLTELKNQTVAKLESVHIYELLDETSKAAPENHFGMLYDLSNPKIHLYVVTAFSGGNLTAAEQYEVTSRGLLTDAQIAAYKAAAGTSPTPTPAPSCSVSPNNSVVTSPGPSLCDSAHNVWTISSAGTVLINGAAAGISSSVIELAYVNGVIWQENSNLLWWSYSGGGAWAPVGGTSISPLAPAPTPTPTPTPTPVPSYALSVSSPASGANIAGVVQVVGSGPGFLNVEIYNSAGTLIGRATPSSTGAFSIPIDTTKLSNGIQALKIDAWDSAAGQPFTHTAQASLSVNVQNIVVAPIDLQAPTVAILSPANGSNFVHSSLIMVTASASDNVGVAQVQFYLNGSLICTQAPAASFQCQMRLPRRARTNTIKVMAKDAAGNVGQSSITVYDH